MKTLRGAGCALFLLVVCLPYAAGQKENTEPPVLTWRDADTRSVLFTSDDMISFDWDKQVFLLNRDATLDFLAWIPPHMHQSRRIAVEDAKGRIYDAHWVSGVSSRGFSGPVYAPLSPNPFFSIENGYPGGRGRISSVKDPRFAPRLKAALEKAGALGSIDLNGDYGGLAIQTTGHEWKDVGEDMKVRVEYFEDTFRLGEMARAHVFFAGGEKTRKQIDSVSFEITLVANEGAFRSDTTIEGVPASEIDDGICVCRFAPWQPVEGSDKEAEGGTGAILLAILFQERNKTVHRLDFAESRVPIRGRTETDQKASPDRE